ncbi:uncharacterized protein LOC128727321 [Anopheles nili]|uniref:uncharacterized protein LOC128727321 n=1 Tax=Anopheles nili TaxID=185578 RepID=UPI00237B6088|nr:uncharacterized protein LOC128727321 [Anopheles nili]
MSAAGGNGRCGSVRYAKVRLGSATEAPVATAASASSASTGELETRGKQRGTRAGVLPPNVDGRLRGTLTVGFGRFGESPRSGSVSCTGIRWTTAKVYVNVDLQVIWWGQKTTDTIGTLHWAQRRNGEGDSVEYEVRTSAELFRRYLKSCEPIRLRLFSKRTETLIGTAKVPLPGRIVNFSESTDQQPAVAQGSGEIVSVRGFRLGELTLEFALKLDPKELSGVPAATKPISVPAAPKGGKENRKMLSVAHRPDPVKICPPKPHSNPLAIEGRPAPLHESSQRPLTGGSSFPAGEKKKFHTLDGSSKRKILNYLTGVAFDDATDGTGCRSSERSALSEICSISPAESMLEALARYDSAPAPGKKPYLQAVDCVRVLIENLRLTRAGQKEIQHRTKHQWWGGGAVQPGFVVKMKLSRSPTTTRLKFCSTAVEYDEAEISFETQPKTTRVTLPVGGGDDGMAFEFGIHLNVGGGYAKERLFYLGSATVTLRELLDGHLCCHKRCPVRLASDDILLGTLTLRMDLGSRGLHFGPELIDAVIVDKGNVTLETSSDSDSSDCSTGGDTFTNPPRPRPHSCTRRPLSCGHGQAASGHRAHGLFPHPSWTCMRTHTGCPSTNQSPATQQARGDGTSQSENQPSSGSGGKNNNADGENQPVGNNQQHADPKAMDTEPSAPGEPPKLLHGLLHLGQLRQLPLDDLFLVAHAFWTDEATTLTSEFCPEEGDFNYQRTFPVLPDGAFIERVRNQHMLVELWQKPPGEGEKLVGVTRLPLHQFYIAFRDVQLSGHLSHAKLPVISIDGWSGIGSPLSGEPCGQIQAVLAIGTESQIELFKATRNLRHTSGDVPRSLANRCTLPPSAVSSPSRRIYPRPDHKSIQTMSSGTAGVKQTQSSEVANMLSAFIENLAQRLPISSERSTAPSYDHNAPVPGQPMDTNGGGVFGSSPHSNANRPQLRKTADLLDNLQKALAQRPPASALDGFGGLAGLGVATLLGASTTPADQTPPAAGAGNGSTHGVPPMHQPAGNDDNDDDGPLVVQMGGNSPNVSRTDASCEGTGSKHSPDESAPLDECKMFRVAIEIEEAANFPKLPISQKYAKRHKMRNLPVTLELEPSTYATFEGYNLKRGTPNTVKSHEGIVYTTHVLVRSCSPAWQKRFEVQLPVDLMLNDEKQFIVKVWRKASQSVAGNASKNRLVPSPMQDAVLGFCAIDLSVLLSGMPYIRGWYHIKDFSGRCNGQIKVKVQPLENVLVYKTLDEQMNFQIPLSIDVDCGSIGLDAASNTSLSRALKRKFTELEEITERLKARLFNVTGDDDGTDPDDQFERDLNTEADEEDDDDDCWPDQLGDMSNQKRNSQYPNGALTLTTNTSSYSMCSSNERRATAGPQERTLTGCSNRAQSGPTGLQLEDLLHTHDLDTLINPAILKNLLNPSTSDSTPPLGDTGEAATDADMSDANSQSSFLPVDGVKTHEVDGAGSAGDRVKQIASALQRTTISDANTDGPGMVTVTSGKRREAPEGEPMKDVDN